jgi:hypothetical protein
VLVRPTIVLRERRYERQVEAAASALALQAAKLHALLAEPLTRPLGSMQTPRCFAGDDGITLIQSKSVGVAYEPAPACHDVELRDTLPTSEPVRYDSGHARFTTPDADTYHGLREIRETAHARLASLEAAAASGRALPHVEPTNARPGLASRASELGTEPQPYLGGAPWSQHRPDVAAFMDRGAQARTAAVRPPRVAHGRIDAPDRTATVQRARSEGLTDARNALRSAYAASKLHAPNAPARSSARRAGVVDGWERLPDRKAKRSRTRGTHPRAVWRHLSND